MSSSKITIHKELGLEIIHLRDVGYSYPEHTHSTTYTIGHITSGEVVIRRQNQNEAVVGHSTFVICPCEPHAIIAKTVYSMCAISISASYVQDLTLDQAWLVLSQLDIRIPATQLYGALVRIYSCFSKPAAPKDKQVEEMTIYIRRHPEARLNLEQIAEAVFSSKYHAIRKFRKQVGLTPHRYQIQSRVRKAQKLLEKEVTMTEVAQAVGFYDQSHFNKHFKAVVGMTPSEYKDALCIC